MPVYRAVLRTPVVGPKQKRVIGPWPCATPDNRSFGQDNQVQTIKCWRGHCFPLLHPPVCTIDRGDDLLASLTAHGPAVVAQFILWNRVKYAVAKTDEAV
jgi:hypothetical protein